MKKPFLRISDHALLCHLDRAEGVDVEEVREALAHQLDTLVPEQMQDGIRGVVLDTLSYRIKGRSVVDVVPRNQAERGRRGAHPRMDRDS